MSERFEDILKNRREKLEKIRGAGKDPFPSITHRTHTNAEALAAFEALSDQKISLAGRVRSFRDMGKIAFAHLEDGSGKIQLLFKQDELAERFSFLVETLDIGDFLEATGTLFLTKTGEKTLAVSDYHILAKSLRPLPSEHYGLENEEVKLRKRYLDILTNPGTKEIFVRKNKFWASVREFLTAQGFLEMEMPVLEPVPGGAEARPFITHHNALDRDFYLRISLELPLKKMLVAGYEKVFEIGRIFRNEGIDTEHLQDYTQMEFYWAYGSFDQLIDFVRQMYQYVIEKTFGTLTLTSRGQTVDWSGEWEKVSYFEIFKQQTGLDLETASDDDLRAYAESQNLKFAPHDGRGRLIDTIFKKVRQAIPGGKPVFLVDQPVELEPLAKKDPKNPKVVQRMQILAYGTELGKGFGELNDPVDQRSRFEDQMKLREAGDDEAQMLDEDFLEAMEYGMPPAAGFGFSERLFAILEGRSVRETVVFPPMKEK